MAEKKCYKEGVMVHLDLPGYHDGDDITILNATYVGRKKIENPDDPEPTHQRYSEDYIIILFKDNVTGAKKSHTIYSPKYTFFYNDTGEDFTYNLLFVEKEKVVPITCKYVDILKAIAQLTNNEQYLLDCKSNGNFDRLRQLHTHPNVFMSDIDIESYYRFLFGLQFKNTVCKLNKSFMDIEVDNKYAANDFPESGECPINAISFLDEKSNMEYQLLLRNPKNPLIAEYEKYINTTQGMEDLKEFVINYIGKKKAKKFGIDKLNFKIIFFDDELELITTFFVLVNMCCPDIAEFWNMAFDLQYFIDRIPRLTSMPVEEIICDKRMRDRYLKFYVDQKNINEYAERGDFVGISSYTVFLDQMIQFASRRKGRAAYPSFRLDAIGETVGVRKLDYSDITDNIANLPYINYKIFSWYNILDTIVQKCIETSTEDVEYVFAKCIMNNTPYARAHRQSVYLYNRFAKDFYDYGYIIGNNKNKRNEKPTIKFPGAMVGDPTHNDPSVLINVNGRPTMLADNLVDFDYTSLYPSDIEENNLAPNTQIGKITIDKQVHSKEHPDMYSNSDLVANYSRGGEFLENRMSGNIIEFCKRWFHLGGLIDVINDIKEYFKFNKYRGKSITYYDEKLVPAMYEIKDPVTPVFKENPYSSKLTPAIYMLDKLSDNIKSDLIEEVRKGALL